MDSYKIYLAKPISGRSFDEVVGYYETTRLELASFGYSVLVPMTGKGFLRNEKKFRAYGYDKYPVSTNKAIKNRDMWMIKNSNIVYANLYDAEEVSIGCVSEIAWAHVLGKHVITAMEDGGWHYHAFILEQSDIIFNNHEEAMLYLKTLIRGKV